MFGDLGNRLVRAGLVTRAALSRAAARVPAHDAALVRELITEGVHADAIAGYFVAEGFGPAVTRPELERALGAESPIPQSALREFRALPLARTSQGWIVAVTTPGCQPASAELERLLGAPLLPRAVSESLLTPLLPPPAPAPRPSEPEPVLELRRTRSIPSVAARPKRPTPVFGTGAVSVEAVANFGSGEFERTPSRVATLPPPAAVPRMAPIKMPLLLDAPPPIKAADSPSPNTVATGVSEAARTESPSPSERHRLDGMDRWDLPTPSSPPPSSRPRVEVGPLLAPVRTASSRDEAIERAFDALGDTARRAVFLALKRGVLQGWAGRGAGLTTDGVRNLWIPTSAPSRFQHVGDATEASRGPHGREIPDEMFSAAIGSRGGDLSLHPIRVRGRVVGVLACDGVTGVGFRRAEQVGRALEETLERLLRDQRG